MSDATIEAVRGRFAQISAELSQAGGGGSITAGFAAFVSDDSPMDLIERADVDLLAARAQRRGPLRVVAQARNGQK